MPCTSQWDCACHSMGAGLCTASHGSSHSRLQSLHASILLCLVGQLVCVKAHTQPATATTSSSLGSLADPGDSRSGCIQLFSQWYQEITGATPVATMPCTGPMGTWDVSRSMHAAMGQAQSAPVVSLSHLHWCGQRLSEPPARCLPGSRPSGSITMLMWPGISLLCSSASSQAPNHRMVQPVRPLRRQGGM